MNRNSNLDRSGRSLVWLGHQLPKLRLNNFDLNKYREFLFGKYSAQYARLQYSYVVKYGSLMDSPAEINNIPLSIRSNVLKSLISLSKYLGKYESFRSQLKNYGIKWVSADNSFNSFLAIVNNNHSTLGSWYSNALNALSGNEKLWLKFTLLTGLRKSEAICSFNLIIKLAMEGNLGGYFNEELQILEHFKQLDSQDKPIYLRTTKNVFISIVSKELVQQIADSEPVYYTTVRKHLQKNKLTLRIKELRSFYATFLRKNRILSEYIDLIQGRIPKSVFARHYLKIEDLKALVSQVLAMTATIESSLLS